MMTWCWMVEIWNDLNAEPEPFQKLLAQQIVCVRIFSLKTTKICLNNKWILKKAENNKHRIMIFAIFYTSSFFLLLCFPPNDGYFLFQKRKIIRKSDSTIINNRILFEMKNDPVRVDNWGEVKCNLEWIRQYLLCAICEMHLNSWSKLRYETHNNIKRNSNKKINSKELWTEQWKRRNSKMKSKPITLNSVQWIQSQLKFEEENGNLKIAWICSLEAIHS